MTFISNWVTDKIRNQVGGRHIALKRALALWVAVE